MRHIDWPTIAVPIAQALWGDPNQQLSSCDRLRWGSKGSRVLHVKRGTWYDFETGEGGGVLSLVAREVGSEKAALSWLHCHGFVQNETLVNSARILTPKTVPVLATQQPQDGVGRSEYAWARSLWDRSDPVPLDPAHPARRWCGPDGLKSGCWPASRAWPPSIRWIPAPRLHPQHEGAGSLVAALASLDAWRSAWPTIPRIESVQVLALDVDGSPCLDRLATNGGLSKRTCGPSAGLCSMIGAVHARVPLAVVEGIADAMALASLRGGIAIALLGTAGFRNGDLARDLARCPNGVQVCPDGDNAGLAAGKALVRTIRIKGGKAILWNPVEQGYAGLDPADVAVMLEARRGARAVHRMTSGKENGR